MVVLEYDDEREDVILGFGFKVQSELKTKHLIIN